MIKRMLCLAALIVPLCFSSCKNGNEGQKEEVKPGIPTDLKYSITDNNVSLEWTAGANAEGYEITLNGTTYTSTSTTYVFNNLPYDRSYIFRVKSVKGALSSDWAETRFVVAYPAGDWVGQWQIDDYSGVFSAGGVEFPLDFLPTGGVGSIEDKTIEFTEEGMVPGEVSLNLSGIENIPFLPAEISQGIVMKANAEGLYGSIIVSNETVFTFPQPIILGNIPGFDILVQMISEGIIPGAGEMIGGLLATTELYSISSKVNTFTSSCNKTAGGGNSANLDMTGSGTVRFNTSLDEMNIPILGNAGDLINGVIGELTFDISMSISKK